jgi:hypothetical protein
MTVVFNNTTHAYTVNLLRGIDHDRDLPEGVENLTFNLQGTNAGAPVQTLLTVRVEDDMAGGTLVLGTTFNENLSGDSMGGPAGPNVMVGAEGRDILAGGSGADTFMWLKGDAGRLFGFADPIPTDVINDFTLGTYNVATTGYAAPDRIDLSSLLQGESLANLENYIQIEKSGTSMLMHISVNGNFAGAYNPALADQHIDIKNVSLAGTTNAEFLNELISKGQLVIG